MIYSFIGIYFTFLHCMLNKPIRACQIPGTIFGAGVMRQFTELLTRCNRITTCIVIQRCGLHVTAPKYDKLYDPEDEYQSRLAQRKGWLDYNDIVYAPTKDGESPKPAEICHLRDMIPVSPKKFWYAARLVRGLSIDEAIRQCQFNKKCSAKIVMEVLKEAQEMAVTDFNVEFESNLWVADSFVQENYRANSYRRPKKQRFSKLTIRFSTYFVRLREGQPPKHYYPPEPSGQEKLEDYVRGQRKRRIISSL